MKKIWLKNVLEKQNEKNKKHSIIILENHIRKQINNCKKRKLTNYHVPLIITGYPSYDIHNLYIIINKNKKEDEYVNINNNQIIIKWKNPKKKTFPEIEKILHLIENEIEKSINKYTTMCIFDVPVLLNSCPIYDYEKTIKRIIKILTNEGFTINRTCYTRINISWSNVKLKHEKNKEDSDNDSDNNKDYFIELNSLNKKANKFLIS
jgi:hypothetical protein